MLFPQSIDNPNPKKISPSPYLSELSLRAAQPIKTLLGAQKKSHHQRACKHRTRPQHKSRIKTNWYNEENEKGEKGIKKVPARLYLAIS